jgi:hypothetical protein
MWQGVASPPPRPGNTGGGATGTMRRAALPARRRLYRHAFLAASATPATPPALAARTVTPGLTPVFRDSDIVLVRQIEGHISARLGRPVQVVKRRTCREVTSLLVAGQLDAAWICGHPIVQRRDALEFLSTKTRNADFTDTRHGDPGQRGVAGPTGRLAAFSLTTR